MRAVLETHFSCSDCGNELELKYEAEIDKNKWKNRTSTECTDVSGAFKIEKRVFVVPCRYCLQPAEDIMRAVEILTKKHR